VIFLLIKPNFSFGEKREEMKQLFYPRSLVIIGVSSEQTNLGRNIVENLDRFSYKGEIYLVGQKRSRLGDRPIYDKIEDLPGRPELAAILTPARTIPEIINACGRLGIRWAVIESGGFSEYSEDGRQIERQLVEFARQYGIRFVGPNCIGIMNLDNGMVLPFALMDPAMNRKGSISLISQSGGIAASVMKFFSCENLGFNKFISIGNKIDLNENDYLDYLIKDPKTSVIGLYLESISDGRELMRLAMSTDKPIVLLKANTSPESYQIACFHTSALAGDNDICAAALAQAGIHQVHTLAGLIEHFKVFLLPPMNGPNLAVIGRSGSHGVLAADAAATHGFMLPQISKKVLNFIQSRIRSGVINMTNPLDLGDVFGIEYYIDVVEAVLREKQINGILLMQNYTHIIGMEDIGKHIGAIQELSQRYKKPVATCFFIERNEFFQFKTAIEFPLFIEAESALEALAASYRHTTRKKKDAFPIVSLKRSDLPSEGTFLASPEDVFRRFESWGLAVTKFHLIQDLETGLIAANEIGYPVVLKIATSKVLHKTEMKGVKIDIQDDHALKAAFKKMEEHFSSSFSGEELKFLIQKMVPNGLEVIVGSKYDPEFGPVILFGLGGLFAEILRDVAIRVAPVSEDQAMEMIHQIRGSALLKGFRGQPPADVESLSQVIKTLSEILINFSEVNQFEINPLLVLGKGQGCVVVDGRIRLNQVAPNVDGK
jgi:acetyltransferase